MDFGIVVFNGYPMSPVKLGRAVEERGFESLFYAEHTHIPVNTQRADGRPAIDYARTYDPFVALAAAAAVTGTLRLGTGVCLVTQRDPIITAKEVASLDHLSGGRFLFGVGAGWNREELANHGTDPRTRMALMAERVQAMRTIWTQDEAQYHGDRVDFDPIWSWPKPAQHPHPPVLVGGNGPGAEDRVLEYGDGWLPQCGPLESVGELRTRVASLRRRAVDAGRGPVPVTLFGVPYDRGLVDQIAEAGVDRCLFPVVGDTEADVLALLDKAADSR
jgi:probable F420-dependent oxidoreductase